MFFLFPVILVFVLGLIFFWKSRITLAKGEKLSKTDVNSLDLAITCFVIAVMLTIIAALLSLFSYSDQIDDYEELKKVAKFEEIYTDKANALTQQFAGYLAGAYPEYEKNIFKEISPDKITFYMVKYPQIQTLSGIKELVVQISQLQNDRYEQQLKRESILKDMRFRTKNPWRCYWWTPTLQELESKYGKVDKDK